MSKRTAQMVPEAHEQIVDASLACAGLRSTTGVADHSPALLSKESQFFKGLRHKRRTGNNRSWAQTAHFVNQGDLPAFKVADPMRNMVDLNPVIQFVQTMFDENCLLCHLHKPTSPSSAYYSSLWRFRRGARSETLDLIL